jgi:hypothetical protein
LQNAKADSYWMHLLFTGVENEKDIERKLKKKKAFA